MKRLVLVSFLIVMPLFGTGAFAKTITVAADGSGDFKTINEAITAAPEHSPDRTIIHIKPGSYDGQTLVPASKPNITFQGEGVDKTILTYAFNQNEPNPSTTDPKYPGIGVVVLADDFQAHDLTFQNTSGDHGQAIALRLNGDRAIITHCHLLGWQDTLRVETGRQYFKDDFIAGRTDFIYGSATAIFDHCEIHSKNGGYVTAASTPQDHPFGLVFLDCKLTGDSIPWNPATTNPAASTEKPRVTPGTSLGRPWRPYASVTFVRCEMGAHINPVGWDNWRNAGNEQTARYAEYQSTGPGANPQKRVAWSKQLTNEQAARLTIENILGEMISGIRRQAARRIIRLPIEPDHFTMLIDTRLKNR